VSIISSTTADRPYTLRPAASHDAEALAELAARLFRDTFGRQNTPEDMALYLAESFSGELQADEIVDPLMHTVIACDERGAMIGYAQLREQPPDIPLDAEKPIELARIYVDGGWLGRGVAGALVDALDAEARRREGDVLWLGVWERNPRAIAFYRKCGFAQIGQQNFVVGTDVQRDLVMTRPLARLRGGASSR
jgi:ribosomal protein S18 acetylase RimI-like enzyme